MRAEFDAQMNDKSCTCASAHPPPPKVTPPVVSVDIIVIDACVRPFHRAIPTIRTSEGWWMAATGDAATIDSIDGGMQSYGVHTFARPAITAAEWKGHAGWFFRVENALYVLPKLPPPYDLSGKSPQVLAATDTACAIVVPGAPLCIRAPEVTKDAQGKLPPIESSFTSAQLP